MSSALVVGAGIGGLTAAAALGRRGWQVEVVEIKKVYAVAGVGIGLRANSLRLLRSLDVTDELLDLGFVRGEFVYHDRHGNFVSTAQTGYAKDGMPYSLGLQRTDLAEVLTRAAENAGAEIHLDATFSRIEQGSSRNGKDGRVGVELTTGKSGEYDLVLGFDGMYSATRRATFGEDAVPRFTGYAAWRVPIERHPSITQNSYFLGFSRIAGAALIGGDRMYLMLVAPQEGKPHHDPERLHEIFRQQHREGGYTCVIADLAASVSSPDGIAYTPFEEILLPTPWHRGRVVILGDAAHSSFPNLGQGASMAIEDALVLAEMLDTPGARDRFEETLGRFYERRLPRVELVHNVSHQLLVDQMNTGTPELYERRIKSMASEHAGQLRSVQDALDAPP